MRRSFVALWLVACALPGWFSLACSSNGSTPSGTGASPGSGGAGNAPSSGGSAGSSASGGAAASGGANATGGSGVSGTTASGGASGTGNAGSSSGGGGGTSGTDSVMGGTAGVTVDDGCALSPQGPVTFSVPSGTFQGTVSIELTTAEVGAEIRYTTDHTPPTTSSALYTGVLAFTHTTELRVQAFSQGAPRGGPQTAVYVALGVDAAHDLPVMILD